MGMIPNIITLVRIIGTLSLFFIEPFSLAFFLIYTVSGISDVLDGFAARKLGAESELGTKLDSIADLFFYAVMLFKIFPTLFDTLPRAIWIAVGCIILIRICSYGIAALKYHRFSSLHTYLNKLTGVTLFLVPYLVKLPCGNVLCIAVCAIAAVAAIEELIIHATSNSYSDKTKTLFLNKVQITSKKVR